MTERSQLDQVSRGHSAAEQESPGQIAQIDDGQPLMKHASSPMVQSSGQEFEKDIVIQNVDTLLDMGGAEIVQDGISEQQRLAGIPKDPEASQDQQQWASEQAREEPLIQEIPAAFQE